MTTLTADELAYIRSATGDDCSPYDVSDAVLNAIYNNSSQGNLGLDCTIAYALRLRYGKSVNLTPTSGELGNNQVNLKHTQIKGLLDYWSDVCGTLGRGGLTVGTINLGLDEPCPDGMDCS